MSKEYQILPAILEKRKKDINKKLALVSDFASWAQIDVVDGAFAPMITWPYTANFFDSFLHNYSLKKADANLELHLMLNYPLDFLEQYGNLGAKRLIAHVESEQTNELIENWKKFGFAEFGLSFKLRTDLSKYRHLGDLSVIQIMCIDEIGKQGSKFSELSIEKVKKARSIFDHYVRIAVDGGIKDTNIKELYLAGARQFAVGSFIFKSANPKETYQRLENILQNQNMLK